MKEDLIKVTVRYKKTKRTRKALVWKCYSTCLGKAKKEAERSLNDEYFGNAVLVSVTEGWKQ